MVDAPLHQDRTNQMTDDYIRGKVDGLRIAQTVILSLSVKPPEPTNRGQEWLYGIKAPVLKELQDMAIKYIDEDIVHLTPIASDI